MLGARNSNFVFISTLLLLVFVAAAAQKGDNAYLLASYRTSSFRCGMRALAQDPADLNYGLDPSWRSAMR
jgi:hypothetical protein